MNLARVLFKKQHHQQQDSKDHVSGDHSAVEGGVEAVETSPTTRSPRRKTRSTTTAVKSSSSTEALRPLHTTVVFKAIKTSSHRRFAQVLPNLLLGTPLPFIVIAARRSALARRLPWRRGCLCVCHVDVLCPND